MKPPPHRYPHVLRAVTSTRLQNHSVSERGIHAAILRPPPSVQYRRHPSLSEDNDLHFPRLLRAHRPADEIRSVTRSAGESDDSPLLSVRAFALLAIIVIIAALVARA